MVKSKGMKKTLIALSLGITLVLQAQEYPFIPKGLKLITMEELMKKPPPMNLDLVYYEEGLKTTMEEVLPKIMSQKLTPKMYVDDNGNYKALVLVRNQTTVEETETKIIYKGMPSELSNLGYSFGNPESQVVIVNTQGGPLPKLLTTQFKDFFVGMGKIDPVKVFVINVHQVQTLHPELFNKEEIPFDKIIEYNKESTKILNDIVLYFKSQNKTVYVTGFSIGAFACADLLAEYGNIADRYLLMVGRLDMTEKVWKAFSEGHYAEFKDDGMEVVIPRSNESEPSTVLEKNLSKIAAGFGHKRYTKLLENVDLSNVIYYYGKKDQNVGRLTQKEIEFLKSKKVNLVTKEGGHEILSVYLEEAFKILMKK